MRADIIEDIYELSPLQHGMLFQTLYAPEAGLYFEQVCLEIQGALNVPAFQRAWERVVQRHGALRTAMQWVDLEKPYQIVYRAVDVPWEQQDWRGLTPPEQSLQLSSWLEADRRRGFTLSEAPLVRFTLIRVADDVYRFIWSIHHLLLDGWSWPLLIKEVFAFYEAERHGKELTLPQPRPYRDYILWLQNQDLASAETFWRRYLDGFTTPTPFHVEQPSSQADRAAGYSRERIALSSETTQSLNALGRSHQLTLNSIVQAAWGLLLSRYSGETDVVFGAVLAGRPPLLEGVESMVGLFINTLPTRVQVSPDLPAAIFIKEVQKRQVEAREYEHTPLVKVQGWSQAPRGAKLFDSVLAFENYPLSSQAGQLSESLAIRKVEAFDLTNYALSVAVAPGTQLCIEIIYDVLRFDQAAIRRMLGHFQRLLEGIAENPECRVSELPLLTSTELHEILTDWNATTTDYPRLPVHQLFEQQAAARPTATALICEGREVSYRELDRRANQVARYLRVRGAAANEIVGLLMDRSIDVIVAMLGILKAGCAYAPFDPSYPSDRLLFMLEDTGTRIVLTQERLLGSIERAETELVAIDSAESPLSRQSREPVDNIVTADHLAYVMYTSGSTGRPKGACVPHKAVVRLVRDTNYMELGPDEVFLQFAPIAFDAATLEIWGPLLNGGQLAVFTGQSTSVQALGEALRQHQVTSLFLTTALFNLMVDNYLETLRGLRQLLFGGEMVSVPRVEKALLGLPACRLIHAYGPTENTTFSTCYTIPRGREGDWSTIPIGKPIANTRVYALDQHLQTVPVGVPAELYTAGDGLAQGYWRRPELTSERFIANPFVPGELMYKTGDLARWRPDGNLEFVARIDTQVKIRGFRIEPGEIEAVLAERADVDAAVVLAREERPGDKRLVAYIVGHNGHRPQPRELKNYLKERLPDYMVPAWYVSLDELPLSANGKVDRSALPAPDTSAADEQETFAAPGTEVERNIAAVWQEALGVQRVGRDDNFFDLGGHSLSLIQVHAKLQQTMKPDLAIVDLFRYTTVRALADFMDRGAAAPEPMPVQLTDRKQETVAIIGMAGRFPGARNIEELWRNLREGIESVVEFTEEQLKAAGVEEGMLADPRYVKLGTTLDGADQFDARFFGINPREAEIMDPQHRVFLECAHEALERAACDPQTYAGRIGVYAGAAMSSYLINNLQTNNEATQGAGPLQVLIGNDKDFVPTRVAYKLNLKGPAVNVQTACSTSLVAVHMACESLLNGACDVALAGGVSVRFPQPAGYLYQDEGIGSSDGHCRVFDAKADGTVGGNGAAIVVLKRLSDAVADGDLIHAVILGSAINNDGSNKVGYTAPSVEGQSAVIAEAQARAGVDPESIGYIEAHGTGTHLGDPIEVAALTQAFRRKTPANGCCAIGSVKSNLGHLDAAAGVTGLIKTVLQLQHQELVPSLHFERSNPKIDFASSPFFVNTTLRPWDQKGRPHRAGISSFGIGGTNAHVIVEEAPVATRGGPSREWQIVLAAGKTETALLQTSRNLVAHIKENIELPLADVAYTTHVGRTCYDWRRAVLCRTADEAVSAMESLDPQRVWSDHRDSQRPVVFLFPGQGSQYVRMARDLYDNEPVFREELDRCADILRPHLEGRDLREILYPAADGLEGAERELIQTRIAQPALFAVEYALARLWMGWGIRPEAMIGHSIGEYVAACLAGVMSLESALELVAVRGRLMQELPGGAMLAVEMTETDTEQVAGNRLCVAAVNGTRLCVLSGPLGAIDEVERELAAQGRNPRRLRTSHAFHSEMMQPILEQFAAQVGRFPLQPPVIPYISNVTGTWVQAGEATDPQYWAAHLRQRVRFADGIGELLGDEERILLEVGPGRTLCTLARKHPRCESGRTIYNSLPQADEQKRDVENIMQTLTRLWVAGAQVDWQGFHAREDRRRVLLPNYPFERQRYWIAAGRATPGHTANRELTRKENIADWFYAPSWKRVTSASVVVSDSPVRQRASWLIFTDTRGIGHAMSERLRMAGHKVTSVAAGDRYSRLGNSGFQIDPAKPDHYDALLQDLRRSAATPQNIVHLWTIADETSHRDSPEFFERCQDRGFFSLLFLAQALGRQTESAQVRLSVISAQVHDVSGGETTCPENATILGPCRVIPQEYPHIQCHNIDVVPSELVDDTSGTALDRILAEIASTSPHAVIAYRHGYAWAETFERVPLLAPESGARRLRERGVYLITGGLGGIGLTLAEYLARTARARLTLTGRKPFPPRSEWDNWLATHDPTNDVSAKICKIRDFEALGAEILIVTADITEDQAMREVVKLTRQQFGDINGVIHTAGVAGGGMIQFRGAEAVRQVFAPKIKGTQVLSEVFKNSDLDFFVLCSSLSAVLGGLGQVDYCAANCFLNAFGQQHALRNGTLTIAIGWDTWREIGMAVNTLDSTGSGEARRRQLEKGISPGEGADVFCRILCTGMSNVIVSTSDLDQRFDQKFGLQAEREVAESKAPTPSLHPRPTLQNAYAGPETEMERTLASVWQKFLGIEQVGVKDNFFELGGDSLLLIQIQAELRQAHLLDIPVTELLRCPTIRMLAGTLNGSHDEPSSVGVEQRAATRQELLRKRRDLRRER